METKEQINQAQGVKGARNRRLTVSVMAHDLYQLPPTEPNVDKYTALIGDDGFESRYGDQNKSFETGVYMGYKMIWDIEAANKNGEDRGYDVELYSVYHNPTPGNPNFFSTPELYPGKNKKTIQGTIVNSPLLPDIDDNYTIYFSITYNGVPHYYPLDPKLRINQ